MITPLICNECIELYGLILEIWTKKQLIIQLGLRFKSLLGHYYKNIAFYISIDLKLWSLHTQTCYI